MKLLRLLLRIFIIVIILIVVGGLIAIKTIDYNRFKPQVISFVSSSIGHEVDIKKLSLKTSLLKGVVLKLDDISVYDNVADEKQIIASIELLHADVNVLAYIQKKRIEISEIRLEAPHFVLRKPLMDENQVTENKTNETTLPSEEQQNNNTTTAKKQSPVQKESQKEIPEVLIGSLAINKGTIRIIDPNNKVVPDFSIAQIQFKLLNFSLTEAFDFDLQCSLWSETKNISLKGSVLVSQANKQIRIDDLKFETHLSEITFESFQREVAIVNQSGLSGYLRGDIEILVDQMIVAENGLLVLSLNGHLKNGTANLRDLKDTVENIEMTIEASETDLIVNKFSLKIADSQLLGKLRVDDYQKQKKLSFESTINNFNINQIKAVSQNKYSTQGLLDVQLKGNALLASDVISTLSSEGGFQIKDVVLKDLNILKEALTHLPFPSILKATPLAQEIEQIILAKLPDYAKQEVAQNYTVFSIIEGGAKFNDSKLFVNSLKLKSELFSVSAKGTIDKNLNTAFSQSLRLSEKISRDIVESTPEFAAILDDSQILIPLKDYNGPLDKFKTYPYYTNAVEKNVLRAYAKSEAKKALSGLIGKEINATSNLSGEGSENTGSEVQSPEDLIIDTILNNIPIFK